MANIIITIVLTALVVFFWMKLYYAPLVIDSVDLQMKIDIMHSWQDFITANIHSCFTVEHCKQCQELIMLYQKNFTGQIPRDTFIAGLESMWNRLDSRYKAIMEKDELAEITIDQLIN